MPDQSTENAEFSYRAFIRYSHRDTSCARWLLTKLETYTIPRELRAAVDREGNPITTKLGKFFRDRDEFRVMQTNALRGFLYEFGIVLPEGHRALAKAWPTAWAGLTERVPTMLLDSLREQWARVQQMDSEIAAIERRLAGALRASEPCQRIAAMPGIGLLTATAAVATIGEPTSFKSGRAFAAWLGLVPRQSGTGGRIRQLGLSKRGDAYLRTLLIHGARAVIARNKHSPWLAALLQRRPYSVAVAALANKLARTVWALLARRRAYDGAAFSAP